MQNYSKVLKSNFQYYQRIKVVLNNVLLSSNITFSGWWAFLPKFAKFDQNFSQKIYQITIFNTSFYSKLNAEFKYFYRIQFAFHVLKIIKFQPTPPVKIYCNIINPKKGPPSGKSKRTFFQDNFYGLHAGNTKNSIWKPC